MDFPEDLKCLLEQVLPDISILMAVYPHFETRGNLDDCVSTFKLWSALLLRQRSASLSDKVVDTG